MGREQHCQEIGLLKDGEMDWQEMVVAEEVVWLPGQVMMTGLSDDG